MHAPRPRWLVSSDRGRVQVAGEPTSLTSPGGGRKFGRPTPASGGAHVPVPARSAGWYGLRRGSAPLRRIHRQTLVRAPPPRPRTPPPDSAFGHRNGGPSGDVDRDDTRREARLSCRSL